MSRQYVIENGKENNRWLVKIDREGRGVYLTQTNHYRAGIEEAVLFDQKAEAVAFAKKWKARVWQLKGGMPSTLVWPEGEQ